MGLPPGGLHVPSMRLRSLLLALLWLPSAVRAEAAPDPAYLDELLAAARLAEVSQGVPWLRLGHWRETRDGGQESEADGPGFFLAPGGKQDPAAELEATLRAFFAPAPPESGPTVGAPPLETPLRGSSGRAEAPGAPASGGSIPGAPAAAEHAQCRFPARFAFLAHALHVDPARLPARACPRFEAFWNRLSARSVTMVFSAFYVNTPASAFGHTFLRLGKEEPGAPGERYELIDQGVDFAATVDGSNAVVYALKGLTGLYHGEFSARPFFYKVREYADFESRDLWEYDLALTPGEVALLVAHLWELGQTWFDYYYATENCSYHVLGALEAAAPRLELLRHVRAVTLPVDAVKALFANPGLVRGVQFRPSARTQFDARAARLPAPQLDAVAALADGDEPPGLAAAPAAERVAVLDTALDLVDVRHGRALVEGTDPAAEQLRQRLLERRSAIPLASPALAIEPPSGGGPEVGHGALRLGVGVGASSADGPLTVIDVRSALHDLADPPRGFPLGTQLEFFKLRASVAPRGPRFRLDEASLVEATALNDFDRFDRRFSWKLRVGALRVTDAGCDGCVAGRLEFGAGPAWLAAGGRLAAALTADVELLGSPGLRGPGDLFLRPGVGPGGLVRWAGERFALMGWGGWRWLPAATPGSSFQLGALARVHLGPVSLGAEWRRTPIATEGLLALFLYRG